MLPGNAWRPTCGATPDGRTVSPINRDTFNYAPVAVGVVFAFAGIYWLVSARKWFEGPKAQGDEAHLSKIEAEFTNIERELAEVD